MDEDALFKVLKRQTKATLLELLYSAYYETNTQQRRHVFGDLMKESKSSKNLAQDIIRESEQTTETQAQENVLLKQLEATALPDLWLKLYWMIHFAFLAFAEGLAVPRY